MIFAVIVAVATAIAFGFILLFWLSPEFRVWVEEPKYRFLDQERRFDESATKHDEHE